MTTTENTLSKFDYAGLELRVLTIMGERWFVGSDVCKALGLYVRPNGTAEVNTAVRHLGDDERDTYPIRTDSGQRRLICLSESGLYKLIMRSDKPEAVKFQDWVTRDVLPSIRKTGGYLLNEEARETAHADDRQGMPLPELFAQAMQQFQLPLTLGGSLSPSGQHIPYVEAMIRPRHCSGNRGSPGGSSSLARKTDASLR